ncbi:VOC family protein [Microbacterium sp. SORGH_AS_0888]|uniref:VOC family protein n=1 Tax=Microbacterium sp. SORGH_AS_0888 TaxID=3041791 RepID=UPI00278BA214|nr:VOC family protein [Microbacterium sp. SORGH_AS_0888]MDQ1130324.1 catechol 2,3-dioxygenase-like lactoylglutathione lyase family enzyme [Microbacterium sp. SORGH_AS_0888]
MTPSRPLNELIRDVAILVSDVDRSVAFYRDVLGFRLEHRMPGFADFVGPQVRLALWERAHFSSHIGFDPGTDGGGPQVMIAVHLPAPSDVDAQHRMLLDRGVDVIRAPADYRAWNARALYFRGPDGEVWELYAWFDGGEPGEL